MPIITKLEFKAPEEARQRGIGVLDQHAIAKWKCEFLNEMIPQPCLLPPVELVNHRAQPETKRRNVSPEFWQRTDVKKFMDKKWEANLFNKTSWNELEDILAHLKEGEDDTLICKVRIKINEFKEFFSREQEKPYEALRIRSSTVKSKVDDENISKVVSLFKGTLKTRSLHRSIGGKEDV